MKDWKTTAAGAGAAVLNALATGGFEGDWKALAASVSIALIGYFAKDSKG